MDCRSQLSDVQTHGGTTPVLTFLHWPPFFDLIFLDGLVFLTFQFELWGVLFLPDLLSKINVFS